MVTTVLETDFPPQDGDAQEECVATPTEITSDQYNVLMDGTADFLLIQDREDVATNDLVHVSRFCGKNIMKTVAFNHNEMQTIIFRSSAATENSGKFKLLIRAEM